MTLATHGAAGDDMVAANAQKRFQFAVDADIDVLAGLRAGKVQPFHMRSPYRGFAVAVFRKVEEPTIGLSDGDNANGLPAPITVK
jgi:hypothetical protein